MGKATTFPPYSKLYASPRGPHPNGILSRDSQVGVPKFANLRLPWFWGPITFSVDLRLIWGLKQSCNPRRELSNGICHVTCTQVNRVDSRLLVVGSQIPSLTPGLSFDHNLCFKYPNGSCEPMSDIYVPRSFQWHKESLNPMSFDPCNCSLKIQESTGTPTPKVGVPLGVWGFVPSHFFALSGAWNVTPGLPFWLAFLQALCLGCKPKARVATQYDVMEYLWNHCGLIDVLHWLWSKNELTMDCKLELLKIVGGLKMN